MATARTKQMTTGKGKNQGDLDGFLRINAADSADWLMYYTVLPRVTSVETYSHRA